MSASSHGTWAPSLEATAACPSQPTLAACSEKPHEGLVSLESDGTSWWLWHRGTGEKRWLPAGSGPWALHHHNSMAYVTDGQTTSWANEYFEESLLTDAAGTWLYNRVERSFESYSVRLRAFLRYAVCLRSSDLRADAMVLTVPRHANVCIYWEARGVAAWVVGDLASKSGQEGARWHLNRWQTWAKLVADAGMDRALLERGVSPMARRQAPGQSSSLPFDRASMSSGPLVAILSHCASHAKHAAADRARAHAALAAFLGTFFTSPVDFTFEDGQNELVCPCDGASLDFSMLLQARCSKAFAGLLTFLRHRLRMEA
jgi:hypothetical protein